MPVGPEMPSIDMLADIAAGFGMDIADDELASYRALAAGTVNACRFLETLPEKRLPVKYARDAGWRPALQDNPQNGWYWRCNIEGSGKGVLKGLNVAIKDAVCIAGLPMMNGSRVLEGFVPDVDATIVTRILDAGGTIVGKTNCEDFSFSGAGHTCSHGPVGNPHRPSHNPGGSSNGSAVVIVNGDADVAIGGDQGGSIRLPASWSGCYGLKPTYGLVPYTGCAMIETTIDHVGPMARDTEGLARLLTAIAGLDPEDPRQRGVIGLDYKPDYLAALKKGVKGRKIAIVREGFGQDGADVGFPPASKEVDRRVAQAARRFETLGATVEEISLPMHLDGFHLWNVIITLGSAEFMLKGSGLGSNWKGFYNTNLGEALARGLKSRINDLPATAKSVLLTGEYLQREYLGRYYWKAQNLRHHLNAAYDDALSRYDMLAMPTTPFPATEMAGRDASVLDTVSSALNMLRNTCIADVTGHPSISIPCGMEDGLPFGLMLTAGQLQDATLLAASAAFEGLGDWKSM
ncbi:amidase [Mesorhizobium sp. YIM 152430]|uniref:amidase n=1 Tax=Mesorhizobium sp. YIM 152430 TaxID=3031761 RepID=UPI0023DAEEF4|nr:amidase [Mesorhizobium sp. YIM 152430]MDF1599174.1 amidase [Mesorhizobium sp. YIM 152430]